MGVNESTLFAATSSRGLHRSTDNGKNWEWIYAPGSGNIVSISLKDSSIFLGFRNDYSKRSSDNGKTWFDLQPYFSATTTVCGESIFMVTVDGLKQSKDDGKTWVKNTSLKDEATVLAVKGTTLYAATNTGYVYSTSDNTETWTKGSENLKSNSITALTVMGTTLYVGTIDRGVYQSTDNGNSWVMVNNGLKNLTVEYLVANSNSLFVGTKDSSVFRSTDRGGTWIPVTIGIQKKIISSIVAYGSKVFATALGEGLFESTDNGDTWTAVGMPAQDVYSLTSNGSTIFAGTFQINSSSGGIYRSTDNGDTWKFIGLNGENIYSLTMNKSAVFANLSLEGELYKSIDNGDTWNEIGIGLTAGIAYSLSIERTIILSGKKGGGILRSEDNGNSWDTVCTDNITPMAFAKYGSIIYTGGGRLLYSSSDNGLSWKLIPTNTILKGIASIAVNGDCICVGTASHGVYRSTDKGKTWVETIPGALNLNAITTYGDAIYAGDGHFGIFQSLDNGASWTELNNGFPSHYIRSFTISGSTLFAGTMNSSVWKINLNSLGVFEKSGDGKKNQCLSCYPNPATNTLTIDRTSLQFPENKPVHYTLSTLVGGKVMEFDNREMKFTVQLEGLISGVYCLSAESGGSRAVGLVRVVE